MVEKRAGIQGYGIRGLDAIAVSHLALQKPTADLIHTLASSRTAKRERLIAGMQIVGKIVPGFERFCAKTVVDVDPLPVARPSRLPVFVGGENTIFNIYSESDDQRPVAVLKVNRASIGLTGNKLMEAARVIREEYLTIRQWYLGVDRFIPDEMTVIIGSPIFNMPAVATIQAYIPDRKRGIFEDFLQDELVDTIQSEPPLERSFVAFGTQLLGQWRDHSTCIDILGDRNVSIAERPREHRLLLIDPHVIITPQLLADNNPELAERVDMRIEQVENVLASL